MATKEPAKVSFKPRILVVDDEKRIRDGCRKVLNQEGFEVACAECGELGLEMIEKEFYDIVLLDLMMPALSGFDVLARIKALHPDAVVIIISGYATVEHSIEAMKKGAFDFIPKPFSPDQLRLQVTKAIEYTRALQDIANEKSRMRVLINSLSDGVLATDREKKIVLANPTVLRMVGYCGEGVVIGQPVSKLITNERLNQMIDQALAMPADEFFELTEEINGELQGKNANVVLNARCIPFRDRIGRNLGTVTLLNDITALKKMDQIRSDFVSMVAHEIRSPMNSILMQLKVILDGLAGEVTSKQVEILRRTSGQIEGLVRFCSELLDLVKIESGLISQERENLDVSEIVESQVALHRAKAEAKGIALELEPLPKLQRLLVNRQNIEMVLSNLITNAINYTPEGGRVTVFAAVTNSYLIISVNDTGFGIPEEDQEKIFSTFYRVKNKQTRFIVGTGLGLAIVKRIVAAHNGIIRVESEVGQGSTFYVYLPLAAGH